MDAALFKQRNFMTTNKKAVTTKRQGKTKPEALFILGMHRAGTSALTRCMSLMGYQLPKTLMGANTSNQKGHWESTRLARLNDRILSYFGADWQSWLPLDMSRLPAETGSQFINEIIAVLGGEYDDGQSIVIKDPRISRLLPLYERATQKAGYEAKFILASRNPLEVASSLNARNDMGATESQMLWLRYNLDAEIATRKAARAFIDFGFLLSAPHDYLAAAIKFAKLSPPYALSDVRRSIDNFLDKTHRHDSRSLEEVMLDHEHRDWSGQAYQAWLVLCENPASKPSLKTFDKIRSEFNVAAPQLLRQLTAFRTDADETARLHRKSHDKMSSDIAALRENISDLKASVQKKDAEFAAISRENRQQQKELNKAFEDIQILKQQLSDRSDVKKALKETSLKLSGLAAEAKTLRSEKRQLNREKWALQDRARFASDMVSALQQSTSWKVTKPLRFVKRLINPQAVSMTPSRHSPTPPPSGLERQDGSSPEHVLSPPQALDIKPSKPVTPNQMAKVESSDLFDPVFYVSSYPDVQSQDLEPLAHYLAIGWQKGYNPSEKFNTDAYLAAYPELKAKGDNPLLHYLTSNHGQKIKASDRKAVGRIAVFMAVAGDYDSIKDPEIVSDKADYFIFTDQELPPNSIWQKRDFEYFDADPTRMARFIKTHPHLYFGDYDWALWMDANLQINVPPEDIIAPFAATHVLATWTHPLRRCIFDEAKECEKRSKDDGQVMSAQMERYKSAGFTAGAGLFETSVMASKMNEPSITAVMNKWWAEIEQGSRRDQLSLPFALRGLNIEVAALAPKGICMRSDPRFNYYRHQK